MLFKFQNPEGQPVEVDVPDQVVAEVLVPKDAVDAKVEAARRQAIAKLRKDGLVLDRPLEELLEDEATLGTLAEKHKDFFTQRLNIKRTADAGELERMQAKWREQEVTPLQQQLKQKDMELNEGRLNKLRAEVSQHPALHDDVKDLVALQMERLVKWDPEHRDWFVVTPGTDDFEITDHPQKGKPPYKTVTEYLNEIHAKDERKGWFKPGVKPGAGYAGAPGGRQPEPALDDQIKEAEAKGDFALAGTLKAAKLRTARPS